MIYFDNAATGGFKPYTVSEAVTSTVKYLCANPTRSGHKLANAGGEAVFRTRKLLSDMFSCGAPDRVVFTKNCTEALNTAILGILKPGDHAIATCAEHNSVLRPLCRLEGLGVETDYVFPEKTAYISQERFISYADVKPLIKKNTRMVIVVHASNVNGAEADIHDIGTGLKRDHPSVIFAVDGAQSGGHVKIDMAADGIDILCLAGHKGLCGIMGSGVLLFNERCDIRPLCFGGTGSDSLNLDQPYHYPDRLESGTLNLPAIVALYEGALFVEENMNKSAAYLKKLTAAAIDGLKRIDGIKVYSRPNPFGIAAFEAEGVPSEVVSETLSEEYDIAVRGGFHCAPKMHEYLGTLNEGLVRISLSIWNTAKETERFLSAVKNIAAKS